MWRPPEPGPAVTAGWGRWRRRPGLPIAGVLALAVAVGVLVAWRLARPATEPLPLAVVATAPLPGHASRFDYADVDPAGNRLFLAHMGDGTLLELDAGSGA